MNNRDSYILEKIILYCQQLKGTCESFGNTEKAFNSNYVFQNACGMCIIQIGELAGKLSEETRLEISGIPWVLIRAMRNAFAHDYGSMDIEKTWATIRDDIPALRAACERYLEDR